MSFYKKEHMWPLRFVKISDFALSMTYIEPCMLNGYSAWQSWLVFWENICYEITPVWYEVNAAAIFQLALEKYEEMFPAFTDSRECKLLKVSETACFFYCSENRIDAWLLVLIRSIIYLLNNDGGLWSYCEKRGRMTIPIMFSYVKYVSGYFQIPAS